MKNIESMQMNNTISDKVILEVLQRLGVPITKPPAPLTRGDLDANLPKNAYIPVVKTTK